MTRNVRRENGGEHKLVVRSGERWRERHWSEGTRNFQEGENIPTLQQYPAKDQGGEAAVAIMDFCKRWPWRVLVSGRYPSAMSFSFGRTFRAAHFPSSPRGPYLRYRDTGAEVKTQAAAHITKGRFAVRGKSCGSSTAGELQEERNRGC